MPISNRHLPNTYYVPSIVLGAEDKAVSKTNMVAPLTELSMGHGGWSRTRHQTLMVIV